MAIKSIKKDEKIIDVSDKSIDEITQLLLPDELKVEYIEQCFEEIERCLKEIDDKIFNSSLPALYSNYFFERTDIIRKHLGIKRKSDD